MKIVLETKKRRKRFHETRGRKPFMEKAIKLNAYFPKSLVKRMKKLYDRGVSMKLPLKFTISLVLREGALMFIREQNAMLTKATNGHLHAKPRPRHFRFAVTNKKQTQRSHED